MHCALAFLISVVAVPAFAAPCAGFDDVDDTSAFCTSVEWMRNRGITLGCAVNLYCPADPVDRLQLAVFLDRMGKVVFQQGGNAFGDTAVVGTTDNQAVEVRVNNVRVMRYEPGLPGAVSPSLIGGHPANQGSLHGSTIGGGGSAQLQNRVWSDFGTIGGGEGNVAGLYATVGGGFTNTALAPTSTVIGGSNNLAGAWGSTVLGGRDNTIGGGPSTSVAAGHNTSITHVNTFLWNGWSGDVPASSFRANSFELRGENGLSVDYGAPDGIGAGSQWVLIGPAVGKAIDTSTGASLSVGGVWTNASDVNVKDDFRAVDISDILERVARLPIKTWRYRVEDGGIRHLGPVAQDFHAAFGFGQDERAIATVDADGVALAAIQGLNAKLEAERASKDAEMATLRAELADIRAMLARRSPVSAVTAH